MKSKMLMIAVAITGLIACEGLGTIDVNTTLSKSISVQVEEITDAAGAMLKSSIDADYPFYETETVDLSENDDLEEYLDNINEMEIYSVTCKLNGIPEGESIKELTVFSTTVGLSVTLNDITENNSSLELEISAAILKAIGEQLLQYEVLEVGVSGYSSYAPLNFSVLLSFDTKVTADLI